MVAEIKANYGYDFSHYALASFKSRTLRFANAHRYHNTDQMIDRISADPLHFKDFLHTLVVRSTEILRDPSFWRTMRSAIMPALCKESKLRIWVMGCNEGPELFSLLILLQEMNLLGKAEIKATEIHEGLMDRAKKGLYRREGIEISEKNYQRFDGQLSLQHYFKATESHFQLTPSLLENVTFEKFDPVTDNHIKGDFDLIIARNLLIYYNHQLHERVQTALHSCLAPHGHLAIGAREQLLGTTVKAHFSVINADEHIYRKA